MNDFRKTGKAHGLSKLDSSFAPFLIAAIVAVLMPDNAFAITAPTAGVAQDLYDIAVTSILKGPIGFVGGVGAVAWGATLAIKSEVMGAIPAMLGGAALLKADTIVESMGMLI